MASTQSPGKTFNLELAAPATATAAPEGGSVQFIGTATTLIRYGNLTIMTDPNFLHKGDHVHLGYGITATRVTNPAIEFEELPEVDFVVLSHMHDDHFDKFVQEHLDKSMPIITCMEASRKLEKIGFTATIGLNTWDRVEVQKGDVKVRVTSAPGKHGLYGGQMILPSVMGSVLDFGANADAPDYRLYISGDTLIYDDLKTIPQRFPGIDLALLHLGGTRILGVFKVTMDGDDGVQMLKILHPEKAIPIHYNDYDAFKSPLQDFIDAVKAAGLEDKVHYLNHGETYDFTVRQRERRTV